MSTFCIIHKETYTSTQRIRTSGMIDAIYEWIDENIDEPSYRGIENGPVWVSAGDTIEWRLKVVLSNPEDADMFLLRWGGVYDVKVEMP